MARARFVFTTRHEDATLSGGSWDSANPLANLQQDRLSKVTRSVNALAASTRIDFDMGVDRPIIRFVGIARQNLSTAGVWRVTASDVSAAGSEIYDSGDIAAWPVVYQPEDLEWEDDNWWEGVITAEEAEGYPMPLEIDIESNIRARYWRIQFTDTSNPEGYVEIAGLWMGPVTEFTRNVSFGAALGWENRSVTDYSLGGAAFTEYKQPARVYRFTLNRLTDAEAYGTILDAQRRVGTDQYMWVIPNWDDTARRFKRDFMCRIRRHDPLAQTANRLHDTTFELEEKL